MNKLGDDLRGIRQSFYIAAERALKLARVRLEDHYRPMGVELRHVWVIMCANEKACTQKEISRLLGWNQNTMVEVIDEMEKRELVTRIRNPANRRESIITLLPKGRKLMDTVQLQFFDAALVAFSPLTLDDLIHMREMAHKILDSTK